jgi:hypothetical protein
VVLSAGKVEDSYLKYGAIFKYDVILVKGNMQANMREPGSLLRRLSISSSMRPRYLPFHGVFLTEEALDSYQ